MCVNHKFSSWKIQFKLKHFAFTELTNSQFKLDSSYVCFAFVNLFIQTFLFIIGEKNMQALPLTWH